MNKPFPFWEYPCADTVLTSYRYLGRANQWIMIGALDHLDALREVQRSLTRDRACMDRLEVWNGEKYVSAFQEVSAND